MDPASGASSWRKVDTPVDTTAVEATLKSKLDGHEERIGELIRRIWSLGSVPIIVTRSEADFRVDAGGVVYAPPGPDGTPDTSNYAVMSALNARATRACRAVDAICLNLGVELRFDDLDFRDICRFTPKGAVHIADWLHDKLKDVITDARPDRRFGTREREEEEEAPSPVSSPSRRHLSFSFSLISRTSASRRDNRPRLRSCSKASLRGTAGAPK